MEFEFTDSLKTVSGLAGQIFTSRADAGRLAEIERERGFDADTWRTLGDSDLIGIALPESVGGAGLGMLGLLAVLEQQGRSLVPVPLWPVIATAALPLVEFGTREQIEEWLPGILDGSRLVVGAFDTGAGRAPRVRAEARVGGWSLTGQVVATPYAGDAAALVVPVQLPDGDDAVVLVRTDADGLDRTALSVTNHESSATVDLSDVAVSRDDVLLGDGARISEWVLRRARVALAALSIGVCSEAMVRTAAYTSQREQFGRPLSTNQAVAVRAADAHLDAESIRLTTMRAAWLMDRGDEDESEAAALVAKWWASRGGLRVVHATQHLHGGMGADVDYPIHRYFLWGRQIAFTLGSAAAVGAALGDVLAEGASIGSPE